MAYRNIYSSMNPYAQQGREDRPPGSRGTPTPDHPTDPTLGPREGGGGEPMPPGQRHPNSPPGNTPMSYPQAIPAPTAVDPGFASSAGGPAGVGGTGGYGFTNMAQYMYANPAGTGAGSGYAPSPGGGAEFNSAMHGYAPNGGAYTGGMAGVDNALNQVYQRNSAQPAAAPVGQGPLPSGSPAGSGSYYPNIYDNINRRRY